jgi:hypothetical protein
VFVDPAGPSEERYKSFDVCLVTPEALAEYRRKRPDDIDPACYTNAPGDGRIWGICGSVSPNGIDWTPISEPLLMLQSDGSNHCFWDPYIKKYVAYVRLRYYHRRAIGRTETENFRIFPSPEILAFSEANLPPSHEWYGSGDVSRYPGTTDYHIMFPYLWRVEEDSFYTYLATSAEGKLWSIPEPGIIMPPGDFSGQGAGGFIFIGQLQELPGDRVGVMADGLPFPHKYPFRPSHPPCSRHWAIWQRERLVALVADGMAEFRTPLIEFIGTRMIINARTKYVGSIRIEIMDNDNRPVSGRSFEDCDPIIGDFLDKEVSWKGLREIGSKSGQPVKLRFRLQAAELFALRFV